MQEFPWWDEMPPEELKTWENGARRTPEQRHGHLSREMGT